MAGHHETGKQGEDMAAEYLLGRGYAILHRNWRFSHYEIDIIALKNNILHIIEVKARYYVEGGNPEDSVTKKKFRNLLNAADEFLYKHPEYRLVQYDILAITLHKHKDPEYFLLEDVYL